LIYTETVENCVEITAFYPEFEREPVTSSVFQRFAPRWCAHIAPRYRAAATRKNRGERGQPDDSVTPLLGERRKGGSPEGPATADDHPLHANATLY
jgi:hypothetical protein